MGSFAKTSFEKGENYKKFFGSVHAAQIVIGTG